MKVKVNPGWQLGLPEGGKLYYAGDTVDVPDALAEEWISSGQAVAAKADSPKKAKAVKASKNKAVTSVANKGVTMTPTVEPVTKTFGSYQSSKP